MTAPTKRTRTIEERGRLVYDLMSKVQELAHTRNVPHDDLEAIVSLIQELAHDGDYTHRSIPLDQPGIRVVQSVIQPAISFMQGLIHETEVVKPGEEWAIGFGMDCGFTGRLILQIDSFGKCADHQGKEPEQEVDAGAKIPWPFLNIKPDETRH